jgi:transcriptional regulator with XRE-family HTH domain
MTVTRFRLREILEEIGMSQSELSRQSGVSFATINRMCTNATRQVSLDTLERLAKALQREPTELIGRFRE